MWFRLASANWTSTGNLGTMDSISGSWTVTCTTSGGIVKTTGDGMVTKGGTWTGTFTLSEGAEFTSATLTPSSAGTVTPTTSGSTVTVKIENVSANCTLAVVATGGSSSGGSGGDDNSGSGSTTPTTFTYIPSTGTSSKDFTYNIIAGHSYTATITWSELPACADTTLWKIFTTNTANGPTTSADHLIDCIYWARATGSIDTSKGQGENTTSITKTFTATTSTSYINLLIQSISNTPTFTLIITDNDSSSGDGGTSSGTQTFSYSAPTNTTQKYFDYNFVSGKSYKVTGTWSIMTSASEGNSTIWKLFTANEQNSSTSTSTHLIDCIYWARIDGAIDASKGQAANVTSFEKTFTATTSVNYLNIFCQGFTTASTLSITV